MSRRFPAVLVALVGLAIGCQTLVKSDKALAVVVLPENASEDEKFAAAELVRCVETATGVALQTFAENEVPKTGDIRIHVGRDKYVERQGLDLDKLDLDGFVIKTPDAQNLILAGRTPTATQFAVFEFLERFVGVRWFFPGEDGEVIPSIDSLEIGGIDIKEDPVFISRQFSGLRGDGNLWMKHNKMNARIAFHHNLIDVFKPSVYGKTHPEFFPIKNGARFVPPDDHTHAWQPCFTAKGSVEEAVKVICKYFEDHPDATSFSLGVNDSGGHCECPACLAKDVPDKKFLGLYNDVSDRYFEWANKVVEGVTRKYPDKVFGCLAYSNVGNPPERVKVDPRIIPYLTYDRMKYYDPEMAKANQDVTLAWRKACPSIGLYDYIYGYPYFIPRYYPHLMAQYWRFARQAGVKGMYAEAYPNWGEGPKLYVAVKLLWNPDADVDKLLADYYEKCYGKAGDDMRQYFELWEAIWRDRVPKSVWFTGNKGQYLSFSTYGYLECITQDDVKKARSLIDSALAKADTPGTKRRVEVMATMFRFYELNCLTYLGQKSITDSAPSNEQEAVALIRTAARTVDLEAAREQYIANVLGKNPLLSPRIDFLNRYASLNWRGWGQSGFWSGIGYALANPNGEAAKCVREIAAGKSAAASAARDVLDVMARKGTKDLVQNGDFEKGDKTAGDWNLWTRDNIGSITLVRDQAHSGKQSMKLVGIVRGGPHQMLAVQFGKRYLALAFAKANLRSGSKGAAELMVGYRDAKKDYIKGLSGPSTKVRPAAAFWIPVCVPFTVDDRRIGHVLLCPAAADIGNDETIWYDDAALYEFEK